MADDIVQIIENARVDATSLSEFIYYPANVMVQRRLAPSIHTLNYYLDYLHGLELVYSQPTGTVTVNGEEVKTVRQAINDSVDSVVLGDYQTQLEQRVGTNEVSISNLNDSVSDIETSLLDLPVVDGKVPASLVSVSVNSSQEDKNIEFELQKLDTGIIATAKNGGIARTQAEKNADYISIKDFGLVADGVTDDSLKLQTIESAYTNRQIDMLGMDVAVASLPTNNSYYNGRFVINNEYFRIDLAVDSSVTNNNVVIGANTPKLPLDSVRGLTIIGSGSMQNVGDRGRSSTAIGKRALHNMVNGKYNIAVGLESQFYCSSDDGGNSTGTRNVSIGDNSLRFNVLGQGNVVMGRNAGQCLVDTVNNVAIGTNALSGFGSLQFKDLDYIKNVTPITSSDAVAIGANASFWGAGDKSVSIGSGSLTNAKSGADRNVAIGYTALRNLGINCGIHGGTLSNVDKLGSYTMSATQVVLVVTGITVKPNDYINVRFQDGIPAYGDTAYRDPQIYKVKSVSGNNITVDEPNGVVASGSVLVEYVEDMAILHPSTSTNIAIGTGAMWNSTQGNNNIAIGADALSANKGVSNLAIGDFALAGLSSTTATNNVALGYGALRRTFDGEFKSTGVNCVGLGFDTRVSGDNQVSLGNARTSVYAYGAVQDRSDARDKIIEGDITDAHIDFFNDVEFKRYRLDYRDDYIVSNEDGTVTKLDKDGSKARKREHVGVIAQQVEEAMKAHNVDFAGLQHHAVNGGNDVYTVGYQEFIPILGEIVQRQQKQIDELKALIKK